MHSFAVNHGEPPPADMTQAVDRVHVAFNPDTHLLAEYLQAAYQEALDEGVGSALGWYRVAERAEELRA